jgi:hypothetical protein
MWLLNAIEKWDSLFDRVIYFLFCTHDWEFQQKIREQNLRGGFAHDSHVFKCLHCGKFKTVELPPEHE